MHSDLIQPSQNISLSFFLSIQVLNNLQNDRFIIVDLVPDLVDSPHCLLVSSLWPQYQNVSCCPVNQFVVCWFHISHYVGVVSPHPTHNNC